MKNEIKSTPKRLYALIFSLLAIVVVGSLLLLTRKAEPLVIYESDTTIVIKCEKAEDDATLIDYMAKLRDKGKIEFTAENGMITSINGIENPKDFSYCWMLYTSDADMANSAWGTVLYNEVEYGSAILGADKLEIKADNLYIWVYKQF